MLLRSLVKCWLCIIIQSKRKAVQQKWNKPDKQLQAEVDKVLGGNKSPFATDMDYLYLYVTDSVSVDQPTSLPQHVYIISRNEQVKFYGHYREGTVLAVSRLTW
jgi:hypothetical protein